MSVKSDIRKFKDYKDEISYIKGVISVEEKVLLIGSDQFKEDVLGDTKEIKLKKNEFYNLCICEEDYIQDINKYIKKIKENIIIVKNEEQSELTLQYKYLSMDDVDENYSDNNINGDTDFNLHSNNYGNIQDNCKHDCNKCNQEDSFEEQLTDFIEEYAETIEANPSNIRDVLYEMYWEIYENTRINTKLELLQSLGDNIQEESNEINNYYNGDNGNGYMN